MLLISMYYPYPYVAQKHLLSKKQYEKNWDEYNVIWKRPVINIRDTELEKKLYTNLSRSHNRSSDKDDDK